MKHLALLLIYLNLVLLIDAQETVTIELSGTSSILAGEAWELSVLVDGINGEKTVIADMFNGIRHLQTELVLGTGGIARWQFPAGELRQAGTSLVFIRIGETNASFSLEIRPKTLSTLESFTSSNSIPAYGEGSSSLIAFVYDEYGNPIDDAPLNLRITAPSGDYESYLMRSHNGLALQKFNSLGQPGLMRISLNFGSIFDTRTLVQTAGAAQNLTLALSPQCVLADGIDDVWLIATATDAAENPVLDGTVVDFRWENGQGTGILVAGQASLRLPAPQEAANIQFSAQVGDIVAKATLSVRQSRCDD